MSDNNAEEKANQVTFHEMRSAIEEKVDNEVFKAFKQRNYDSKEA